MLKIRLKMTLNGMSSSLLHKYKHRNTFVARIKIMWEEQLANPPIDYATSVNVP